MMGLGIHTVEGVQRLTYLTLGLLLLALTGAFAAGASLGEGRRVALASADAQARIDAARAWTRDRGDLLVSVRAHQHRMAQRLRVLEEEDTNDQVASLLTALCGQADMDLLSVERMPVQAHPFVRQVPVAIKVRGSRTAIPILVSYLNKQRRALLFRSVDVELESFYAEECEATLTWSYLSQATPLPVTGALLPPHLLPRSSQALLARADGEASPPLQTLRNQARELETLWRDLLDYEELLRLRHHHQKIDQTLTELLSESEERSRSLRVALSQLALRLDRSALGRVRVQVGSSGEVHWDSPGGL